MNNGSRELNFGQAINEALRLEMRRDSTIIVMGEDVAGAAGRAHLGLSDAWGGPLRATRGLIKEFGADRVIDTPIAEMGFVGAAVGAAMTGLRPVVEVMFVDLIGVCYDQIINQAAKMHYMMGGRVDLPMVIRTAYGTRGDKRSYGGGAAARVQLFRNRIERISPGGLPPSIPVDNILDEQWSRNPVILAILYESYVLPLTVLSTLPTALVGGLMTLLVFRQEASLYAFVGMFMLMGIVKKNGIMIVDFARQRVDSGEPAEKAMPVFRVKIYNR